jgi:hypothetical protein
MRAIAILVLSVLAVTTGHAAAQAPGAPLITPPTWSFVRPERVYVLPVLWVPADELGVQRSADAAKAKHNLAIQLRTAQAKYRSMMRDYTTATDRGTFALATWDGSASQARVYGELFNTLEPRVVQSTKTWSSLPADARDQSIMGEILTAAGCKVQSCPFVFVVMVAKASSSNTEIYGTPFNYGFNGGGGFLRLPMSKATDAAETTSKLLSTLLHELGHAFGLPHITNYTGDGVTHFIPEGCRNLPGVKESGKDETANDPYDSTSSCPLWQYDVYCNPMPWEQERIEFHCSPSIMGYGKRNRTSGCLVSDSAGTCSMPTATQIFLQVPGVLITENLRDLARNSLVFPELAAEFDLLADDDDGDGEAQWTPGFAYPDGADNVIPGHPLLTVTSSHSSTTSKPRFSFGQHWRAIASLAEPFHKWRHWRSTEVGPSVWVHLDFTFPEPVQLGRVRVYTGSDGGDDQAEMVEVRYGAAGASSTTYCAQASLGGAPDGDVGLYSWCTPSRLQRIRLKTRADSERVVVRMIRFFDMDGHEIQAPAEPVATSADTHAGAYATDPDRVVGGNQVITPYSHAFDADDMWHSREVTTAGIKVDFDVRLPEQHVITAVAVYTGHSSAYHRAERVEVWTRGASGANILRTDVATGADAMIFLPTPVAATHVRLKLKTGASKHVVIRGVRFFTAAGEVYVPRSAFAGIYPLL